MTGYSVTVREPEWTPERRARREALQLHQGECCPGCGLHKSVLDDPENNPLTYEDRYCDVCAAKTIHDRVRHHEHTEADKRLGKDPNPTQRRAGDGHHVWRRPLTPEEAAVAKRRTPPTTR